jgi:TatD DNase family protein
MLIDTHTHIAGTEFDDDRNAVIERALAAGVDRMIVVGTDLSSSEKCVALAEQYSFLWATVGLHPHDAHLLDNAMLGALDRLAAHPKVVGIGETGLDYYYNHSSEEAQRRAFVAQIGLAKRRRLPVVIHSRQAWAQMFEIAEQENLGEHAKTVGAVFHCFTGDRAVAERAVAMGFFLSFSGIVTFPKSKELHEAAAHIDLSHTLVETDAPYLAPQGVRGQRNEPAHVRKVAEHLALLHARPLPEVAHITSQNAERLFGISAV